MLGTGRKVGWGRMDWTSLFDLICLCSGELVCVYVC